MAFEWRRGADCPADLARFKLAMHCGGCALNRREMVSRVGAVEAVFLRDCDVDRRRYSQSPEHLIREQF
ncbi:MAG: hypothetical protein VB144_08110 [Clostridia bacterium]|nr:hypothetical protein [Clostridia bacterium]